MKKKTPAWKKELLGKGDYFMLPNDLLRSSILHPYAICTLAVIASYDPSFPSYETIMNSAGFNCKTLLFRFLKELEARHIIEVHKNGRKNEYEIKPPSGWDLTSALGERFGTSRPRGRYQSSGRTSSVLPEHANKNKRIRAKNQTNRQVKGKPQTAGKSDSFPSETLSSEEKNGSISSNFLSRFRSILNSQKFFDPAPQLIRDFVGDNGESVSLDVLTNILRNTFTGKRLRHYEPMLGLIGTAYSEAVETFYAKNPAAHPKQRYADAALKKLKAELGEKNNDLTQ